MSIIERGVLRFFHSPHFLWESKVFRSLLFCVKYVSTYQFGCIYPYPIKANLEGKRTQSIALTSTSLTGGVFVVHSLIVDISIDISIVFVYTVGISKLNEAHK